MISEGDEAPRFELPAVVDGEHRRVALDEYLGEDVVILAFYPGDFNPACDEESDLDELDLFTMQKDVSVLGISADTLYSHAAFAEAYDLHVPLLSDTRREVAREYGVTFEDAVGQALIERAVFVVDHDGVVRYAWSTQSPLALPDVDAIKDTIGDTGGDDTAFARYRVGHAHYTEGRRAFTSAMGSYQDSEWMLAQSDFGRAQEAFEEAADHFDSAVRFVDDADLSTYYERAEEKATALWQAAEWLSESASEYSSGAGAAGQRLRDDAERPLETARDIGEPIDPDDWPPDLDADDAQSILPQDDDAEVELAIDIDEAATGGPEADAPSLDDTPAGERSSDEAGGEEEIDDDELQEIEAELTANQPDDPTGGDLEETPTSMVDAPPDADDGDAGGDDDPAELQADLETGQSAGEGSRADGPDEERADSTPDTPSLDPDEADVPPPGSGSLEPGGGSGDGAALDDDDGGASLDDGPDQRDHLDETDELDEPDGASDEDMAAIPTEEELAEDDADDDGERY
ncbi:MULTISPECIES: redoxin domain-containing protein [Halomicrobium]|uniref:Alkyl hydroperoxide reductase/ Thiol specific antioxidant/ Mal allergen n=2 Tax=Halomicrobium mukohataei TaxID=57705 RepID=C7NZX1_HALMD|nr:MULTISPECIES: redoxin domain-containing protein [Halomicrobium]ACV46879.1 alkyl hydroperoxide reductase/ Thiol specific antioxidant/ Mal allergen [Halomicrobium mukohataei DSM 12286]QCD65380.1 redoxin domain-containing protein [Halomicrobium mukohataei]QFR20186.1 redoxin domain-containing protein [Halomicrobium sp. ZPS1]